MTKSQIYEVRAVRTETTWVKITRDNKLAAATIAAILAFPALLVWFIL
jgi:hypothetical protein